MRTRLSGGVAGVAGETRRPYADTLWICSNFTTQPRSQPGHSVNWSHLSLDDLKFLDIRKSVCTSYPPGIKRAREVQPDLAAAACVPIRETEAWMLADAGSFCRVFRRTQAPELPKDPEAIADPKRHLAEVLKGMGARVLGLLAQAGDGLDSYGTVVQARQEVEVPAIGSNRELSEVVEAVDALFKGASSCEVVPSRCATTPQPYTLR
jgi:hypothetical protein